MQAEEGVFEGASIPSWHSNFACRAVVPGRTFLRFFLLFNLTVGLTHASFQIRLSASTRADLNAWQLFPKIFNGSSSFLPSEASSAVSLKFFPDASGFAFAGVCGSHWFVEHFPEAWFTRCITIKELLPIALCFKL